MLSLLRSSLSRSSHALALRASIPRTLPTLRAVQARTFLTTSVARAPAAKKPAAKTTARKTAAKKPAAKKPAAKKSTAKKAATKTTKKAVAKKEPKKAKAKKTPSLPTGNEPPKRPLIGFALYTKAHSEIYPYRVEEGQSKAEAWKKWHDELLQRWNGLTEAQKKVYYEQAAAARVVYGQQMQQWLDATPPDEVARQKRLLHKKGRAIPQEMKMPRRDGLKKPLTAYFSFLVDYRARQMRERGVEKVTRQESIDLVKQGAVLWNGMSESEKEPYYKKYSEQKAEYLEKLEKLKKAAV